MKNYLKEHKLILFLWMAMFALLIIVVVIFFPQHKPPTPQTAKVTRKTLTQIVSASGQVVSSKQLMITTQASGRIKTIYVKPGNFIKQGSKIMEIDPDRITIQNETTAWSNYLTTKNALADAQAELYTLQNDEFVANQKFVKDKGISHPTDQDKQDPIYIEENATWLAAEAKYKNQQNVIAQLQVAVNNAYLAYQQTAHIITSPMDGVIKDISLSTGMAILGSSTTPLPVATLKTAGKLTATLNVSELDIAAIRRGQNVSITLTALPNKIYMGKVISAGTTGTTSSGITTFPVIIEISDDRENILAGMSISGDITTKVENNVLSLPNQAITTSNNKQYVTRIKNDKQQIVPVTVGLVLDTETEILSGVSEGDVIVLSKASANPSDNQPASEGQNMSIQ